MATEVTQLCGPKHSRTEGDHYLAGSSPGRVLYEGEQTYVFTRETIKTFNNERDIPCPWPQAQLDQVV